ncbi:hypothetical protein GCM10012275_08730 [Longimycelium tulufanense]|uniref:Uncharacterized protein n=1 Tax=Longimycelium tulufanense TaxID=907463 RepID=A0A8J3CB13_9PSEU|nr:hypothetical protein [Longimycelium tulufanense]GGM40032.1 hypothetical protein GCM10012275_08730 [Longimycelium tulufanense]
MTELAAHPCRSLCSWHPTRVERDGMPVLACRGCGTQWVRTEPWTPIDHTGHIPDAVRAEVARR